MLIEEKKNCVTKVEKMLLQNNNNYNRQMCVKRLTAAKRSINKGLTSPKVVHHSSIAMAIMGRVSSINIVDSITVQRR